MRCSWTIFIFNKKDKKCKEGYSFTPLYVYKAFVSIIVLVIYSIASSYLATCCWPITDVNTSNLHNCIYFGKSLFVSLLQVITIKHSNITKQNLITASNVIFNWRAKLTKKQLQWFVFWWRVRFRYTQTSIILLCKPQWFIVSGENWSKRRGRRRNTVQKNFCREVGWNYCTKIGRNV